MKTLPNARQAMEYVNTVTGIPELVCDYRSRSGPGSIAFEVKFPNYPTLDPMRQVIDAFTAQFGEPKRLGNKMTNFVWDLGSGRRVRVRRTAFSRAYFNIVLEDDAGDGLEAELFDI